MSITFPKPGLLKPKIPGVVAIGLLVAQFIFFEVSQTPEPSCNIIVERPHYSSYLKEFKSLDAIKLNITSKCNVPQKFTRIFATIQEIRSNRQTTAHVFESRDARPLKKDETLAQFQDLFTNCEKGKPALYSGQASGQVHLKSGRVIKVVGVSDKFTAVPCRIQAK